MSEETKDPAASLLSITTLLDENDNEAAQEDRQAYLQRLRTFTPATYFAKPLSLSPIVAARFGWTSVQADLLKCVHCQASWAVPSCSLMETLATSSQQQLIMDTMEPQLSSAHFEHCGFRYEALQYLRNDDDKASSSVATVVIPTSFARFLPRDVLASVEAENPQSLLVRQYQELVDQLLDGLSLAETAVDADATTAAPSASQATTKKTKPLVKIFVENHHHDPKVPSILLQPPEQVRNFALDQATTGPTPTSTNHHLLERVWRALPTTDSAILSGDTRDTVLALVLLGWKASSGTTTETSSTNDQQNDSQSSTATDSHGHPDEKKKLTLECPLCLATMSVCTIQQDGSSIDSAASGSPRPTKRLRPSPHGEADSIMLKQHRYYCPYVSGFVYPGTGGKCGPPLWQHLASQLLKSSVDKDRRNGDAPLSFEEKDQWIHKVLRSATSSSVSLS